MIHLFCLKNDNDGYHGFLIKMEIKLLLLVFNWQILICPLFRRSTTVVFELNGNPTYPDVFTAMWYYTHGEFPVLHMWICNMSAWDRILLRYWLPFYHLGLLMAVHSHSSTHNIMFLYSEYLCRKQLSIFYYSKNLQNCKALHFLAQLQCRLSKVSNLALKI